MVIPLVKAIWYLQSISISSFSYCSCCLNVSSVSLLLSISITIEIPIWRQTHENILFLSMESSTVNAKTRLWIFIMDNKQWWQRIARCHHQVVLRKRYAFLLLKNMRHFECNYQPIKSVLLNLPKCVWPHSITIFHITKSSGSAVAT